MKTVVSRSVELFYRNYGEVVELYPRFSIDEGMLNAPNAPCLSRGLTLAEQMRRKPDSIICFWRTFALGDILLLTPIFNWLKETYPDCQIRLVTVEGFQGLFRYWDAIKSINKRTLHFDEYDAGYYLDGVVEKDHEGGPYSKMHRLDIYCHFLGIPVPKDPFFSLPYGEEERAWAEETVSKVRQNGKPVLVMQISGSTKLKSLPDDKRVWIARELSKTCSLIAVHNHREAINIDSVLDLSGQTSVHQLTALIDCADIVLTMDSGLLWVAHCTGTPVITLLGPTRESERLIYHRNYYCVNLSGMIGCEPCFERMTRCEGKVNCMIGPDPREIVEEIQNGIRRVLGT